MEETGLSSGGAKAARCDTREKDFTSEERSGAFDTTTLFSEMKLDGENEDDGDEIVKEIDVFMSTTLAKQLFVFHYPLRPPWRPYNRSHLQEVRYKAVKKKIELEFRVSKEELENNYDTQTTNPKKTYVLASSAPVEPKTNYAVGVLRDDQLHLTPVQGTFQFRPSFQHIDSAEQEKKKKDKAEEQGEDQKEEKDEKVMVRVKRTETPKAKAARERSHQHQKQMEAEEPWLPLKFKDHMVTPDDTESVFSKLFAKSREPLPFDVPMSQYSDQIATGSYKDEEAEELKRTVPPTEELVGKSLFQIREYPLEYQVLALFVNAHILPWNKLCEMLYIGEERENEVLSVIEKSAILVAGRWIVRSDVRYEGKLATAREFMLYLFTKHRNVKRQEFVQATGIPFDHVKQLLSEIGVLKKKKNRPQRVWKLRIPEDTEFIRKYPEMASRHAEYWAESTSMLFKNLEQVYLSGETADGDPMAFISPPGMTVGMGKKKDQAEAETSASVKEFLHKLFGEYGVCTFNFIKQHFVSHQKEDPILATVSFKDTFVPILEDVAGTLHNAYYLRRTGTSTDKYREIIIELFSKDISLRKADVTKVIEQRLGETNLSPSMYKTLLREFATVKGNTWIFKAGTGN